MMVCAANIFLSHSYFLFMMLNTNLIYGLGRLIKKAILEISMGGKTILFNLLTLVCLEMGNLKKIII